MSKAWQKPRQLIGKLLRGGATPSQLAAAVALGAVVSVCPIIGLPTPLLTVLALAFRLNLPLIQVVNYLGTAPQWLLIVPFLRLGEWLTRSDSLPLTPTEIADRLRDDALAFFIEFGVAGWHAALGWMVVGIPAGIGLYLALVRVFTRAAARVAARRGGTGSEDAADDRSGTGPGAEGRHDSA